MKKLSITKKDIIPCFCWVYLLNCIDLCFTCTFLKLGGFIEANPIMRPFINNSFLAIIAKIIFPALLLIYLFLNYDEISPKDYKYYFMGAFILTLIYSLVDALHIYYLTLFL